MSKRKAEVDSPYSQWYQVEWSCRNGHRTTCRAKVLKADDFGQIQGFLRTSGWDYCEECDLGLTEYQFERMASQVQRQFQRQARAYGYELVQEYEDVERIRISGTGLPPGPTDQEEEQI